VALAEMAFSGGLGLSVFLSEAPYKGSAKTKRDDIILFSESNSRFILEVKPEHQKQIEEILKGLPYGLIGCVLGKERLVVHGQSGKAILNESIWDLKESWQKTLRW